MKKKSLMVLLLAVLLIVSGCSQQKEQAKEEKTEGLSENSDSIAVVNGTKIPKELFDKNLELITYQYKKMYGEDVFNPENSEIDLLTNVKSTLVDSLITDQLVMDYAKENKIEVSQEKVDETYSQFQEQIKTDDAFQTFLKEKDLNEEFIKESVASQLRINGVIDHLVDQIKNDEQKMKEIKEELYQVRASHILVDSKEKADELVAKLKEDPDSFEELAKAESKDTGSAENGGDLGYFEKGKMVPEFEAAAFEAEKGTITDPIQTTYGYHIIKVVDKRSIADMQKDESIKKEDVDAAIDGAVLRLAHFEYESLIQNLMSSATIEKVTFEPQVIEKNETEQPSDQDKQKEESQETKEEETKKDNQ